MRITLMHRELPVLRASYDASLHRFASIETVGHAEHAPAAAFDAHGLVTLKGLNAWWGARAIPRTRDGYRRLATALPMSSPAQLVEEARGLSLSDTYWLRTAAEEPLSWSDVNYFENDFDGELGLVTLGESSARRRSLPAGNPSSSVSGDLPKAWVTDMDGTRTLLKAGRGLAAQEVYNEVAATRLYAGVMRTGEFVPYRLVVRRGRVYSACPDMLDGSHDLVSAADLVFNRKRRGNQSSYEWCVSALEVSGAADVERDLCRMLACDFVLGNFDRHYNNFGLVRNAKTLEFEGLAPIYDSGNSLWCNKALLDDPSDYAYEPLPFGYRGDPDRIPQPRTQLEMLGDWRWYREGMFDEAPAIVREVLSEDENLPPARIEKVVRAVQRNVETLSAVAQGQVYQGTCTERMLAAGKRIDPLPCMAALTT